MDGEAQIHILEMTDFANYLILLIDEELKRWSHIKEKPSHLVLSIEDNTQSFLFVEFKEAENAFNVLERVRDGLNDIIDAEKRMLDYFPNLKKLEDPYCEAVMALVKKGKLQVEELHYVELINEKLIYFDGDLRLLVKALIQSAERKLDVTHINGRVEIKRIRTSKKLLLSALELLKDEYCRTDAEVSLFQTFVNYYNLEVNQEEVVGATSSTI